MKVDLKIIKKKGSAFFIGLIEICITYIGKMESKKVMENIIIPKVKLGKKDIGKMEKELNCIRIKFYVLILNFSKYFILIIIFFIFIFFQLFYLSPLIWILKN